MICPLQWLYKESKTIMLVFIQVFLYIYRLYLEALQVRRLENQGLCVCVCMYVCMYVCMHVGR